MNRIRIATLTAPLLAAGLVGGLATTSAQAVNPPPNDQFRQAEVLTGCHATGEGDILGATGQPGEPAHFSVASKPKQSAWSKWRAPQDGNVVVDTEGSDYDTILAVYRGRRIGALTPVASDDDSGTGLLSQVSFNAHEDVTYRIAVDSFGGGEGNYLLNVTC
jgi:hypothetical protein